MENVIEQPEHQDTSISGGESWDSIHDIIAHWCARSPERPAVVDDGGAWTYSQLRTVVDDMESWLLYVGVRRSDRVMVVCEDCRAAVAFFFSLARLDALPVLVNASVPPVKVDEIRDHSHPRLMLYTTNSQEALENAKRYQARLAHPIDWGPIAIGPLDENVEPEDVKGDINRAAVICASGAMTTARLTNGELISNANAAARALSLTPDDRICGLLPISDIAGLSNMLLATLSAGATLYISSGLTAEALTTKLNKDRLTVVMGDRTTFSLLVEYARVRKLKSVVFPALRTICCSGTPLEPTVHAQAEQLFGMVLHCL